MPAHKGLLQKQAANDAELQQCECRAESQQRYRKSQRDTSTALPSAHMSLQDTNFWNDMWTLRCASCVRASCLQTCLLTRACCKNKQQMMLSCNKVSAQQRYYKACIAWSTQGCTEMCGQKPQLCACVCDLSDPILHGCAQVADVMAACCVTIATSFEGQQRPVAASFCFEISGAVFPLVPCWHDKAAVCWTYRPVPGVLGALLSVISSSLCSLNASPPSFLPLLLLLHAMFFHFFSSPLLSLNY